MAGTDEDEAGEENVDHGIVGYEDQDAVSVCTEEDVVLRYHHLNVQTTYPGKEAGVSRPDESSHIPQEHKGYDGYKGNVRVNLVTVQLVPEM